MVLLKKFIDRIKYQGFFSTVNYFLFTVGIEKLGIELIIKYIFSGNVSDHELDEDMKIYEQKSDIPPLFLEELTQACGERFSQSVESKLSRGEKLAIGVSDGHAASISWMKKLNENCVDSNETYWLINGCYTLPTYRGLKLYPRSIKKLTKFALESLQTKQKTNVIIESSIANKASIRGITQCGFQKLGYSINYKDKTLFSSK